MGHLKRASALVSMLALGAAAAAGCTVESVDTKPDSDAGIVGAGGVPATGGAAGTAGSAGAGTGGSAGGSAGTGGTAGTAGDSGVIGGECLGDVGTADAKPSCDDLPYAADDCGGIQPLGKDLCDRMAASGRDEVFEELHTCLMAVAPTQGSCSVEHDDAVMLADGSCVDQVFTLACDASTVSIGDAGGFGCPDITLAACPPGDGGTGITAGECEGTLFAFNDEGRSEILDCAINGTSTGDCVDDFTLCAFPFLANAPTACLDATLADPSFNGVCANHTFATENCSGNTPLFMDICQRVETDGRAGTFEALFNCYTSSITDATAACDESANAATFTCFDDAFDRSCVWTSLEARCATLAGNTCGDANDQITADDCDLTLAGFSLASAQAILTCAEGSNPGCATDLQTCAFP